MQKNCYKKITVTFLFFVKNYQKENFVCVIFQHRNATFVWINTWLPATNFFPAKCTFFHSSALMHENLMKPEVNIAFDNHRKSVERQGSYWVYQEETLYVKCSDYCTNRKIRLSLKVSHESITFFLLHLPWGEVQIY